MLLKMPVIRRDSIKQLKQAVTAGKEFIRVDIWRIRLNELPLLKSLWVKWLRIALVTWREFEKHHCQLRASALTFYSILSIVPVAAMAFGIAKGFGVEKRLETELYQSFPGQEDVLEKVISFAETLLLNTQGGLIAGIGIGVLFWTVIKVLWNIEISLNAVWYVEHSRAPMRKMTDYLSMMIIGPFLMIISGSATVFVKTQILMITQEIALLGMVAPLIFFLLKFIPLGLVWLLFTVVYKFMPNTQVNLLSAFSAGIIAGTLYQTLQWTYIHFQVGVAKYNAIYGSFAALPLFLFWLQLSWLIVMLGAVISAAVQNIDNYEFSPDSKNISPEFRKLLSLQVFHLMIRRFLDKKTPLSAREISNKLEIPFVLVRDIIHDLMDCGLAARIYAEDCEERRFLPAQDAHIITAGYVINTLDQNGCSDLPVVQDEAYQSLSKTVASFRESIAASEDDCLLKDI